MTPHFFAMDKQNYSRWLPVYLADMQSLESKHPTVYNEFTSRNHVVCRSSNPFFQVSYDMALEQSLNAHCKPKCGIVGISGLQLYSVFFLALQRWFLTCNERAAITSSLNSMYVVQSDNWSVATHKEASANWITGDEQDIQKLMNFFTSGLMTNPFNEDAAAAS